MQTEIKKLLETNGVNKATITMIELCCEYEKVVEGQNEAILYLNDELNKAENELIKSMSDEELAEMVSDGYVDVECKMNSEYIGAYGYVFMPNNITDEEISVYDRPHRLNSKEGRIIKVDGDNYIVNIDGVDERIKRIWFVIYDNQPENKCNDETCPIIDVDVELDEITEKAKVYKGE